MILLATTGMSDKEIGEKLGTGREVVSKWRMRFWELGIEGLKDWPRMGRPKQEEWSEPAMDLLGVEAAL